ncbi:Na+/H+ antiporter subunit A [soil metagenome]
MLLALLALHAAVALAAPTVARRAGRWVFALCALAPAAVVVWAAGRAGGILAGRAVEETLRWVPALDLAVTLRVDGFSLLMIALVSGVGLLIFAYSWSYFEPRPDLGRFAAALTGFAGAMLGVVVADNLLVLYVFWELTSVTSYLLIGFEDDKEEAREAALQALLVTVAGGLAMLAGFVLIGNAAGTYSLSRVLAEPPTGAAVAVGLLLVLLGAFTKSAQVPFHSWLPAAMVAPTPVSAYLHSATMVKAGVYLVARLAPAFGAVAFWRPLVVGVGVATMLVGGWRALRQFDLKLLLAFGTVSQLGLMTALFGAGTPDATFAGVVLLLAHGAFKCALFLVVGIVDHEAGTRDLRRLSRLRRALPVTFAVAVVAGASMAGLPPLLGFVAKELAYDGFLADAGQVGLGPLAGVVAGSVLTFAYTARFLWGGFVGPADERAGAPPGADAHRPSAAFLAPAVALAVVTVVLGVAPGLVDGLSAAAATALAEHHEPPHLALWHGLTPALWLSVLTVAAGAALFAARGRVEALQGRVGGLPGGQEAYDAAVDGLRRASEGLTAVVQNGSLPVYLAVILLTVVVVPGGAVVLGGSPPSPPPLAESWPQVVVTVGILAASVATVTIRRRFAAVLMLGSVGYGVALLFVIQGAPDLALTQFLVETLSVILFVLVLRHLPDRFSHHHWRLGQALRRVVAVGVGVFMFGFAVVAGTARTQQPISRYFLENSLPEAGGHNVVNVILVDFRGLDTLGEITVLVVAALGVASLVRASRRREPAGP